MKTTDFMINLPKNSNKNYLPIDMEKRKSSKYIRLGKIDNDAEIYFAEEYYDEQTKSNVFKIAIALYGPLAGGPHNPYDIDVHNEAFYLKKVNKTGFDFYIKFLQTNNELFLIQCQRVFND